MFDGEPPVVALCDVTLEIHSGELVIVQGPSGSGKSTLLNQIALIDRPSHGTYEVDGQVTATLCERRRAKLRSDTFGFVFQSFHLMARRSARENVELGLLYRGVGSSRRRVLADQALTRVGLSHRADVAAGKLSGGERQRVAIARAIVADAPIVVADEPTGNLDSTNGEMVVSQLLDLHRSGTSVLIVTHDPDLAARGDRQIRMRDGNIIQDASSESPASRGAQLLAASPMPGRASAIRVADVMSESWRALLTRPGRTALLAAAIGIAVALVIVTLGLGETASAQVSSKFDLLRNRDVTLSVPVSKGVPGTASARTGVAPSGLAQLNRVAGVQAVGVLEQHEPVMARTPGLPPVSGCLVEGISHGLLRADGADVLWTAGPHRLLNSHEVLVGSYLANELQVGPLALNPVLVINNANYAVAGIVKTSRRDPTLVAALVINWRDARSVSALDQSTIYITTSSGAARQVASQAPVALDAVNASRISVSEPASPETLRGAIEHDVSATLMALTIVASLASILGVANAMLLTVIERIGEFGLRRAIGARPIHILAQMTGEAVASGIIGAIVGVIAGFAVILGITIANHWQPTLDLRLALLALIGGILVGAVGGLPASLRASRIQPADALRR